MPIVLIFPLEEAVAAVHNDDLLRAAVDALHELLRELLEVSQLVLLLLKFSEVLFSLRVARHQIFVEVKEVVVSAWPSTLSAACLFLHLL